MKKVLLLLVLATLVGCGYWQFHPIGDGTPTRTRLIDLSGTLPAMSGTPSVTLGGQPATIIGQQWTGRVVLDGAQTEVDLVVAIDGVTVMTRRIAIDVDRL